MKDDSSRVTDLFNSAARDWTPVSVRPTARLLYMPVSFDREVSERCASVLSAEELKTANRFITEDDKNNFIQRRAFRRYCAALALRSERLSLSRIIFEHSPKGRPYISEKPNLWFSFSSCRFGFIGAWSSTHAIGIDIEDQTRNLEITQMGRQFFPEAEAKTVEEAGELERARTFFHFWNLKEAALKSIGEGLPFGFDAFEFALTPKLRIIHAPFGYRSDLFTAHLIETAKIYAALVTRNLL